MRRFYDAAYAWEPATNTWYELFLPHFIEAFPHVPLQPEPVEQFLANLSGEGPTRYHHYRALVTFYRWVSGAPPKGRKARDGRRNRGLGIPNVMEQIQSPPKHMKEATSYSQEELVRVVKAASTFQDRMMLLLLTATQIRSEALRTLTSDKVHEDYIAIKPKDSDKEEQMVACPPEVTSRLKLMGPGLLFTNSKGQPLSRYGVYQRVERCFRLAGVSWGKRGPHALRHTGATLRLEVSEDLTLVQDQLKHASIEQTSMYTHRSTTSKRKRQNETSPYHLLPDELKGQAALALEFNDPPVRG